MSRSPLLALSIVVLNLSRAGSGKSTTSVHQFHTKDCTKVLRSYLAILEGFGSGAPGPFLGGDIGADSAIQQSAAENISATRSSAERCGTERREAALAAQRGSSRRVVEHVLTRMFKQ